MAEWLALDLAGTIRATRDGLTDRLETPEGLTAWVRERAGRLADHLDAASFTADETARRRIVALRQDVRSLLARAVSPDPPSAADADRLPPPAAALERVNRTAGTVPRVLRLDWPPGGEPAALQVTTGPADPAERLAGALAAAAIEFLGGPERDALRLCPAPRCVLYFVKEHPRQEWCSVACGNRARAARYYRHHRGAPAGRGT